MKPLVYISAPYSSDPMANTRDAISDAMPLWNDHGIPVVIPHLTLLADLVFPGMDVDDWYQFDLDVLEHCDAVYRLEGESKGADREVDRARELGLPVFESTHDLLVWAERRTEVIPVDPSLTDAEIDDIKVRWIAQHRPPVRALVSDQTADGQVGHGVGVVACNPKSRTMAPAEARRLGEALIAQARTAQLLREAAK